MDKNIEGKFQLIKAIFARIKAIVFLVSNSMIAQDVVRIIKQFF